MLEDLDIYRAARLLLEKHGSGAEAYAVAWSRALRETGNAKDAVLVDRVVAAIEHLNRVGTSFRKPPRPNRRKNRGRAQIVQITRP